MFSYKNLFIFCLWSRINILILPRYLYMNIPYLFLLGGGQELDQRLWAWLHAQPDRKRLHQRLRVSWIHQHFHTSLCCSTRNAANIYLFLTGELFQRFFLVSLQLQQRLWPGISGQRWPLCRTHRRPATRVQKTTACRGDGTAGQPKV